jgi:hypothetical protein
MLHKCVNPSCSTRFRRLSQGKLFEVEIDAAAGQSVRASAGHTLRRREYYWLCDQCASVLTLTCIEGGVAATVPLSEPRPTKSLAAAPVAGVPAGRSALVQFER